MDFVWYLYLIISTVFLLQNSKEFYFKCCFKLLKPSNVCYIALFGDKFEIRSFSKTKIF